MTKEEAKKFDDINVKMDKITTALEKLVKIEEKHASMDARLVKIEHLADHYSIESPITRVQTLEKDIDSLEKKGWGLFLAIFLSLLGSILNFMRG